MRKEGDLDIDFNQEITQTDYSPECQSSSEPRSLHRTDPNFDHSVSPTPQSLAAYAHAWYEEIGRLNEINRPNYSQ